MYQIHIETDNAAFEHKGAEVARILRDLAAKIEHDGDMSEYFHFLIDLNGNRVGTATTIQAE